ncbi:MAG TPA: hypothetical protein VFY80_10640 [Burkholderiales bacterium]|nr:hypothetical protein [Burkholderiales bacterium]
MQDSMWRIGILLIGISGGAAVAADPASVSIQDLKPECKERHAAVPPEHCLIDDRTSRLDAVRRAGSGDVVIIQSLPPPAAGRERPAASPTENVRPPVR